MPQRDTGRPITTETRSGVRKGTKWLYRGAISLAIIIYLIEAFGVPLLVTFDSYWYAKLAEVLGTARFATDWDYLRTPIFPLLLKLFFRLIGRQPLAVIALQGVLGFGGIWLLSAGLNRVGRKIEAAILFPLLALFPTLVTYEHALLTEIGTFFFLALLLYTVTAPILHPVRRVAELAGVLTLGFYFRSSILYLSPAVALVYAIGARNQAGASGRSIHRISGEALAVMLIPLLLAYPWQRNPLVAERTGKSVLLYGLVRQAVVPPADPLWATARAAYQDAIDQSVNDGKLPLGGIKDQLVYKPVDLLYGYASQAFPVFGKAIIRYPHRYLAGLVRTSLLFTEITPSDSDNVALREALLAGGIYAVSRQPRDFPPLEAGMMRPPQRPASHSACGSSLRSTTYWSLSDSEPLLRFWLTAFFETTPQPWHSASSRSSSSCCTLCCWYPKTEWRCPPIHCFS